MLNIDGKVPINVSKPTCIVLTHLSESRYAYFYAGLSKFFKLKIYYVNWHPVGIGLKFADLYFRPHNFYTWEYDNDCEFIKCNDWQEIDFAEKYDYGFLSEEAVFEQFSIEKRYKEQEKYLKVVSRFRKNVNKLYWCEFGEQPFYVFTQKDFWNQIDGVLKHFVFKKDNLDILNDAEKLLRYTWNNGGVFDRLINDVKKIDIDLINKKTIPVSYNPSILDRKKQIPFNCKLYDMVGSFQGQSSLRVGVMNVIFSSIKDSNFKYLFDYGQDGIRSNVNDIKIKLNPFFWKNKFGKLAFHLINGKYFYPKPWYIYGIRNAKCYLGLGDYVSSMRTPDAMGAGSMLINWDTSEFDYGFPFEKNKHYFSIGDRNDFCDYNNEKTKPLYKAGKEKEIIERVRFALDNKSQQLSIINNASKCYEEYFSSPKQFVYKFFIEKIKL